MPNIDILRQTKEALDKAIAEKKISQEMLKNLSPAIIQTLAPILEKISDNARLTKRDIIDALSQIKINVPKSEVEVRIPEIKVPEANVKVEMPKVNIPEVNVKVPEIKIPKIVIPEIKVPEIKIPTIKIPKMEWPDGNMPVEGLLTLKGISRENPLPVELRDSKGNPLTFPEYIGGGNAARNVRIGGFSQSAYADYINADGRLRVSVETGGSGLTDSELRAAHLDVQQLSGSEDSVVVNNTVTVLQLSGANFSVNSVNESTIDVKQVSGSIDSVFVTGSADSMMAFQARQTNITALADGSDSRPITDDLGRQISRVQVRDLTQSAYATLTNGTETTLLTGVASTFLDLMWLVASNNSDAAVTVDFRSGTAGTALLTLQVPANGTAGIGPNALIKQEVLAGTWTADMGDLTGTTVYISALFSKEV